MLQQIEKFLPVFSALLEALGVSEVIARGVTKVLPRLLQFAKRAHDSGLDVDKELEIMLDGVEYGIIVEAEEKFK